MTACNFLWGSHECDEPADEDHRVHRCGHLEPTKKQLKAVEAGDLDRRLLGPCCEYDEDAPPGTRVRFYYDMEDGSRQAGEWSEYEEGWWQ